MGLLLPALDHAQIRPRASLPVENFSWRRGSLASSRAITPRSVSPFTKNCAASATSSSPMMRTSIRIPVSPSTRLHLARCRQHPVAHSARNRDRAKNRRHLPPVRQPARPAPSRSKSRPARPASEFPSAQSPRLPSSPPLPSRSEDSCVADRFACSMSSPISISISPPANFKRRQRNPEHPKDKTPRQRKRRQHDEAGDRRLTRHPPPPIVIHSRRDREKRPNRRKRIHQEKYRTQRQHRKAHIRPHLRRAAGARCTGPCMASRKFLTEFLR